MKNNIHIGGVVLVLLGTIFFLGNFMDMSFINWAYVWPIILIFVGISLILNKK